jgi:hypothetical protein
MARCCIERELPSEPAGKRNRNPDWALAPPPSIVIMAGQATEVLHERCRQSYGEVRARRDPVRARDGGAPAHSSARR